MLQLSVVLEDYRCALCNEPKSEKRGHSFFQCLFSWTYWKYLSSEFTAIDSVYSNTENMLAALFHMESIILMA
jgi:hypothetical protein